MNEGLCANSDVNTSQLDLRADVTTVRSLPMHNKSGSFVWKGLPNFSSGDTQGGLDVSSSYSAKSKITKANYKT